MTYENRITSTTTLARAAGLSYLAIICLGLWSELAVRSAIAEGGTPEAVVELLRAAAARVRLSVAADAAMVGFDIVLAVLLFALLRGAGPLLAGTAMALRLIQAAVIAANLSLQLRALSWAADADLAAIADPQTRTALAFQAFTEHAAGYDLGLIFFGLSSVLTGILLLRLGHKLLGALLLAAGSVYLTGSTLRLLAPHLSEAFLPAYGIAVIAELSFALWLLLGARGGKGNGG